MIQDIIEISKLNEFKFRHVSRSMLSRVDVLAKLGRKKKQENKTVTAEIL